MKKIFILSLFLFIAAYTYSQDFKTETATAKASYQSGKLEDAHFALQQTLQSLDITIGKEVLKLFPEKMADLPVNGKDDNVAGNVSFVGATIHRTYCKCISNLAAAGRFRQQWQKQSFKNTGI